MDIQHHTVEANGIRIHVAEQGKGPLVLLCHGFPESWYSWRHQLAALAAAGYRAVAPDMRGYGDTDAPAASDRYTMLHLVGDMVGLVGALGETSAVIAGHDWGAPVAWHAALLRPDIFRGVAGLSVPFRGRAPVAPTTVMPRAGGDLFYMLYFQEPGVAEAELERDARDTLRTLLHGFSGEGLDRSMPALVSPEQGFLGPFARPTTLPPWLSEADVDVYAAAFARTGFRGGLNWYRAIDRSWELLAPFAGARLSVPALYVTGDRDLVVSRVGIAGTLAALAEIVPGLRKTLVLPGCGHWTQQERPSEVNAALLEFLRGL